MKYLWDTDTCIYHLNGNSNINRKIQRFGAKAVCTTIVTIAELKFGAFNSTRLEDNLSRIQALQTKIRVLADFNEAIATIFAETKAPLKRQGITIGDFDLLIASFALHHGMILVTNNTEHFQHIPGLQIENWSR